MQIGITEISAIIGGLYIIIRVIILLTPTVRDDEWLKNNAPKWLKVIGLITGLDLKKGIEKYKP